MQDFEWQHIVLKAEQGQPQCVEEARDTASAWAVWMMWTCGQCGGVHSWNTECPWTPDTRLKILRLRCPQIPWPQLLIQTARDFLFFWQISKIAINQEKIIGVNENWVWHMTFELNEMVQYCRLITIDSWAGQCGNRFIWWCVLFVVVSGEWKESSYHTDWSTLSWFWQDQPSVTLDLEKKMTWMTSQRVFLTSQSESLPFLLNSYHAKISIHVNPWNGGLGDAHNFLTSIALCATFSQFWVHLS